MTGAIVGILLALAIVLLDSNFRWATAARAEYPPGGIRSWRRKSAGRRQPDPHDLPLFVHQLAALLQSGRGPQFLWQDALAVYQRSDFLLAGLNLRNPHPPDPHLPRAPAVRPHANGIPLSSAHSQAEATRHHGAGSFALQVIPVLEQAAQSAALGIRPSDALKVAAARCTAGRQPIMAGLWTDLSACLEVSDHCGAPLATILERYAVQLEARLDGIAARDTALAGPRTTVQLLTWLPLFGLGLGVLMGMNPLAILLGTPLGWAFLSAGVLLMAVGRWWSGQLVAAAGQGGFP